MKGSACPITFKMEQFSNSYQDFHNAIKKALLTFPIENDETILITYSEFPWFPGGQFSLALKTDSKFNQMSVVKQYWDYSFDLVRYASGVFNLDRLCIKAETIHLALEQKEQVMNIINYITNIPETLENPNAIIIDGIEYKLELNYQANIKSYEWRSPNLDIYRFKPIIDLLLATYQR